MSSDPPGLRVNLFYSYSHRDMQHKEDLQTTLSTLKRKGFLTDWSDAQITPGQAISETLQAKMLESDIVVFLFSPDFLDSEECLKEWRRAKDMGSSERVVFRLPIIVRDCPWQDFLDEDDVKALPLDGTAITTYQNQDSAWKEVYEGIKYVIETIRTTYTPKQAFLEDLNNADLPTSKPIALDEIFVFPRLVEQEYIGTSDLVHARIISSFSQLHYLGRSMIYGQDKSGKTALAKQLALSLVHDGQPVLFADLGGALRPNAKFLGRLYEDQFNGDYSLWLQRDSKTLIVDNMNDAPNQVEFIERCSEIFSNIYVFVSTDVFQAFLIDEIRLADFHPIRLDPLTLTQQENLIRNQLTALRGEDGFSDGFVDKAEDRVNSIIISNKIVPRYPFFVLAILQTFDALMPPSLSITSYGHCYHVFVVASLTRAGISHADDVLNSCFNFAEQLAFATFRARREADSEPIDFAKFKRDYGSEFIIEKSLLNRLTQKEFGIITDDGKFKHAYMYYFFLGKMLATNSELADTYLRELCDHSDVDGNYLALLFAIHHATNDKIIEDIIVRMMVELENTPIATLNKGETARFASIVSELPRTVLSGGSVEEERAKARQTRDNLEAAQDDELEEQKYEEGDEDSLRMLRTFKNNKILGQVLRNQAGKLPRNKIEEIVETIADSSFRLINLMLKDEDEIRGIAEHFHAKFPEAELDKVQQMVRSLSFLWTLLNIEQAVHAVNVPSIRKAVEAVANRNGTPVYDIFGYFCKLDSAETLTSYIRDCLDELHKKHQDDFVRRVLSLRTQAYMNTHRSKAPVEQSICSVLEIKYRPRPLPAQARTAQTRRAR